MPVVVASSVVVVVAGYSSLRKVLLLTLAIEANTGGNAKFHRMLITYFSNGYCPFLKGNANASVQRANASVQTVMLSTSKLLTLLNNNNHYQYYYVLRKRNDKSNRLNVQAVCAFLFSLGGAKGSARAERRVLAACGLAEVPHAA